jgi:putative ABC transport system permease protein
MRSLLNDFKYGVRSVRKDWRFAAMVVLTLAICIGANTALFTIVNSVLLQPLPVPGADSIILMSNKYPKAGIGDKDYSGAGDYYDRLRAVTSFQEQAMFKPTALTLNEHGSAERISGMLATPSLFRLLEVPPALGRIFTDSEGEVGNHLKVILSYDLWQKLYAGDPSVLGRTLRLNDRPFQIVGVMPRGFLFVDPEVRYWVPLAFTADQKAAHHNNNWYSIGRLKPGATIQSVQGQLNALNAANLELSGPLKPLLVSVGFYTKAGPLKDYLVRDIKGTLFLLWGGAAFVLLIGALNIANLALARASGRTKEFATRLALGASQAQIARQLIVENVVIALLGGAAGLLLGMNALEALGQIGLDRFPRAAEVHVSGAVILFALAVSVLTGIFIALVPFAGIAKMNLTKALRESSRTGTGGRRSRGVRQALAVAQIAFAFVLLAGAGLLLASFRRLLEVNPGFKTEGVLTASTSAPQARYADDASLRILMNRSLAAIRNIPGVTEAGATTTIPWSGDTRDGVILPEGHVMKLGGAIVSPLRLLVTPQYMEAMHMPLLHGRYFQESDNEAAPVVAIVDERLARRFWPNQDAIGRRMYVPQNRSEFERTDEHTRWITIVGVVRSTRIQDLAGGGNQGGAYYFPYAQGPDPSFTFAVSASMDLSAVARAVRAAIAQVDPTLALFDVRTMEQRKELSLSSRRTAMSLALAFGGLALFLSAIGIYSVLSYLLGQRRREIGIRLAVGSSPAGIFQLFLREGMLLIGCGLALGLVGSAALRKAVENQIYGVQPFDPIVLGIVIVLLGGVALAACLRPAQLATKVDPLVVLNEQ